MDQLYWLRRKRDHLALAWSSISSEARLIHFDLAGRYGVKAGEAGKSLPPHTARTKVESVKPR